MRDFNVKFANDSLLFLRAGSSATIQGMEGEVEGIFEDILPFDIRGARETQNLWNRGH